MGFTKWMMKNGIGSVGSVAKCWSKMYIESKQSPNHKTEDELFTSLYVSFQMGLIAAGKEVMMNNPIAITEACEGSLDLLIMFMLLESVEHVKVFYNNKKSLVLATEVVKEIVTEYTNKRTVVTEPEVRELLSKQVDILYKSYYYQHG